MRSILHEIRNHMAVAVANVEAFRDGVLEPSTDRLTAVLQALEEAEVLLGELPIEIVVPRVERQTAPINVCSIISNEMLALEASAREHRIDFRVDTCNHTDRECGSFTADPLQVAEIVNNVVSNAIRYTSAGSRIDVHCHRGDGKLEFTVVDDGPGVAAGERSRIFEWGYRGTAATAGDSGSGIGLAVTKRLVEGLGGSIDVANVRDRGARFTIILPGTSPAARPHKTSDGTISLL